jgi:hypothetical protein
MQSAARDLLSETRNKKDTKFDEQLFYSYPYKNAVQNYVILLVIHILLKPKVNGSSVSHKMNCSATWLLCL